GTGEQAGGRTGGRSGDQGNGRIDGQGGQVGGQGSEVNDGINGVPDFSTIIAQQLRNLLPTIVAQVGDQGSGQGNGRNQNVRNVIENNNQVGTELWNHAMVGASHAAYTDRFHELARLVPHLVTSENKRIERYVYGLAPQIRGMVAATEPSTIQKAVQIAGTLTDEALRNGSIKKNHEKRGNRGEPSKDRNGRDDNKRTRTGNAFAKITNPVRREYTGRGNNGDQACGRTFMLGAEEARQDPNIVAGTFTLNNHYATNLFDSGADYSFVSTTFIPLLGIEPSDLGFSYEIEIASGQLVEIDKVIKGCKLEIEGHVFDINLILFGSGSFDMIIRMEWLSNHKAEIICHEKVVIIPLPNGKVLKVIGKRPKEKMRHLRSAMTKEQKQEEIVVVRDYPKVFPDDLLGLPPNREIEFRIELVPGAIPVAKSPYRLAPSEMEELPGQLKEL
ncbi:putative reverse transcriptase domain-containing protein, partial [Tanacetum coccineum]